MKKLCIVLLALASVPAHAITNTNFTVLARGVMANTSGVLTAPANFFSTNNVLLSTDFTVASGTANSWTGSTRTLTLNTDVVANAFTTSFVSRVTFNVTEGGANAWTGATQTLQISTNYVTAASLSGGGLVIATTNLTVTFGTNSIAFDDRGIVINSTTGRTANIGYTTDTATTGTLRFIHGLLVSPP